MNHSNDPLSSLPPVNDVLSHDSIRILIAQKGRDTVREWVRTVMGELRSNTSNGTTGQDRDAVTRTIAHHVALYASRSDRARLQRVINATGVILHTGLGRAPLSQAATEAIGQLAAATNLELDLESGDRRFRGYQLADAWTALTGAEDSLLVNNNAAATLLALASLAKGREVIISRGQLIEIGGSFRLPEIFEISGAILREVGTTNRTRLSDYERVIGPQTAAVMRVHPSNYHIVGFAETPAIGELAALAHRHELPVIDDIGSGCLIDVAGLGLPTEPTFRDSLASGADLVLGSGDKLLGGPQCGIVLGKASFVGRLRSNPLARAVRIDKLTLAALSATLDAYLLGSEHQEVPTLVLLSQTLEQLRLRADSICRQLGDHGRWEFTVCDDQAPVGGGSLPGAELPTAVIAVAHATRSADSIARMLRTAPLPVLARIQKNLVFIDLRSVLPEDDATLVTAVRILVDEASASD